MTIERITRTTGAEAIDVYCDDPGCHTKLGSKRLHSIHKGYSHDGDKLKPLTPEEIKKAEKVASEHDKSMNFTHAIRILTWKAK